MAWAGADDSGREFPSGPRYVGAGIGLLILLAFLLRVPIASPPELLLLGYPFAAAASALAMIPTATVLILLLAAPGALQRFLSRFTRLDLRDGGHVAAFVVMTITLFYVVGVHTTGGVFAIEQVYGQPPDFEPPPTEAAAGAPGAPNLTLANLTDAGIHLEWTPPEDNASILAYRVYRGLEGGVPTLLQRVENATNLTDEAISFGVQYVYQVTAVNEAGEGLPSETAEVLVPIPENLIIVGVLENTIILVLPALFYVSFVHGVGPREALRRLGLRSDGMLKAILIGIGVVILVMFLLNLALAGLQQVQDLPENERARAIGLGIGLGGAFAIAVGAALSEEVFYRGFLQPRIGMIGQAVVFAVAHVSYVDVVEVSVVFVLAFVFGFLYRRTGNLWAPMAAHFAFNLLNLLFIVCGSDPTRCGLPEA